MDPWRKVSVLDGLCASDAVKPDGLLSHKYRTWALEHPAGGEYPLGSLSMEELAGCNRAAIVVIARRPEQTDCTLTDSETQMLRSVTTAFDRTILVLATPGFVELNDAAMACPAIVWMGIAGQEAGSALADVLTAKALPMAACRSPGPSRVRTSTRRTHRPTSLSATVILIPSARSCAGHSVTVLAMARAHSAA